MRFGRTKSLILLFTASVLLTVTTFVVLDVWRRYERALETADARAGSLAGVVSEYVRGSFAIADTSLRQLVIHAQRVGGASASADEWTPILEAARAAAPGVGSISVTDAQGIIRHSTVPGIVGQGRADTYVFRALAADSSRETLVDEPFLSPLHKGQYVLPFGRRLETPDGTFAGLVVAVIMPTAFDEFFETIDVGAEGIIWVLHPNGVILCRDPSKSDPLGERVPEHPVIVAARQNPAAGRLVGRLRADGPTYVSTYRVLNDPPVIIAVSLSQHEALADWVVQRRNAVAGLSLFYATLCGLVFVLFRQIDARSHAERAFEQAQRAEAARLRDTNERLEEALRREKSARDEAEAASRLKDEFLMTLSHELRTPLNAILGWSHMLVRGTLPDDQRGQALATITRNAQTQARLVEDLLDVSRAITGKLRLDPHPLDAGEVVAAAVETLRPAIAGKGLDFRARIEAGIPELVADSARLQQVVWNLLSNAIKFTPAHGTIELIVRREQAGVEIVVRDTGAGIAPDFLPYVFDRFRQADAGPRRETAGLGLGLSISRHLVELHGGTITAESEGEGLGATFRVRIPAGRRNAPAHQ